ncbi:hypothetical protein [Clostridium sp. 2218st1_F5_2218SCRN_220325]|uniref:hypothetical protein n=1 Tax=Clostridium sp. 2218st1_F5_2218SCRN_220325 TaxID=3143056 RepID=UPI00319E5724
MGANILKRLNENTPDSIKYIFNRVIRNKLINNKLFTKQYLELDTYKELSVNERRNIQLKKLKDHLCYAYENTSYYKKLFDEIGFNPYLFKNEEELNKIPLLTKKDIISNYEDFISKENINYYISSTGGSTGKPLRIYLEKDSIYKEKAFIYNHWSKLGYDYKESKIATFRGVDFKGRIKKYNPLYNEIILNPMKLNEKNIDMYVREINNFKCQYIHGYPSAIYNFCKIISKNNIKLDISIQGVFFISENVYNEQRDFIEKILKCKTLSFYGHSERLVFAEEKNRYYKFNDLYGYTEIIDIDNVNRIVCTGFLNKKMPLIRYLTDDAVEEIDGSYKILGHRNKNVLIGRNDEEISMATMEFHSNVFERVKSYQFEQYEKGKLLFNIVPENILDDCDIENIQKELNKKLNGIIEYKINIVDKVKVTSRGKFDILIQQIK